jgi:hypothetical protein
MCIGIYFKYNRHYFFPLEGKSNCRETYRNNTGEIFDNPITDFSY